MMIPIPEESMNLVFSKSNITFCTSSLTRYLQLTLSAPESHWTFSPGKNGFSVNILHYFLYVGLFSAPYLLTFDTTCVMILG